MHIRTNQDMNHAILYGMRYVPEDVDLIVGIPRSGLLAAMLFSLSLNRPVTDLQGLLEGRVLSTGKRPVHRAGTDPVADARRILVVDDCISQGTEMDRARALLQEAGLSDKATFLAVYSFPQNPHKADIVLEVVPRPMVFQWSCMHSPNLAEFCVDIDGILCADPTKTEDDDGPGYRRFLREAKPLFTPAVEIGWLVTCRLEKYRPETEEWLARHGVRYRHLEMMDHASRIERETAGRHAEYKAEVYRRSGAKLFIESSEGLAKKIADLTDKPVLCFTTDALHYKRPASQRIDVLEQKLRYHFRRLRRAPERLRRMAQQVRPGGQTSLKP